jgi:hypothetical protein
MTMVALFVPALRAKKAPTPVKRTEVGKVI